MTNLTRWIRLALVLTGILACADSARAGLELRFSGTVTSFSDDSTYRDPNGHLVTTPGIADIVAGSTFEGRIFWAYDPALTRVYGGFSAVYGDAPVVEFTVDRTYLFSSEMQPHPAGRYGAFGVAVDPDYRGIGGESINFEGGHASLIGGEVYASVAASTPLTRTLGDLRGEADFLIRQDLDVFASGQLQFGFGSFVGPVGRSIQLDGDVTSLSVVSPEPATLVSAAMAGLVGLGVAAGRKRKAKLAS